MVPRRVAIVRKRRHELAQPVQVASLEFGTEPPRIVDDGQQERDVFQAIADSRSKLAGARTPAETMQAANEQSSALSRLLVVAEAYPELKSSEIFARLSDELAGTENRIATERMRYNEKVQAYNTSRRQFPANLTNMVFKFQDYPLFEAPPEAKQVPKVDFSKPGTAPGR